MARNLRQMDSKTIASLAGSRERERERSPQQSEKSLRYLKGVVAIPELGCMMLTPDSFTRFVDGAPPKVKDWSTKRKSLENYKGCSNKGVIPSFPLLVPVPLYNVSL